MNIKIKLAFQFTAIVVGILIFYSGLLYYFSYSSQKSKFQDNLLRRAKNTGILFMNMKEIDTLLLKKIHQSTFSWQKEEIVLTDSLYRKQYSNNAEVLTNDAIRKISLPEEMVFFRIGSKDGVCYRHSRGKFSYYVFVAAYDSYRAEKLSDLREIIFWSILFSIWLSVLLSYLFSRKAIQPISQIVKSMKQINASKLNQRLPDGNRKDEIDQLAMTFNEMLSDLEVTFRNQKEFVSHASHELRTPVSVMIAETDYFLRHEHLQEEYRERMNRLVDDLKAMNLMLSSLLDLAHLNKDNVLKLSTFRLDENIYSSIQQVKMRYKSRRIVPKVNYSGKDCEYLIEGNPGLLEMAFRNLIENACKFSEEEVFIEMKNQDGRIMVSVVDHGIGIPEEEIENISTPFRRASNAKYKGGFGIGLALVVKILELHQAEFRIISKVDIGTTIEVLFNPAMESKDETPVAE